VIFDSNLYQLSASAAGASQAPSGTSANNTWWTYVNSAAGGVVNVPTGSDSSVNFGLANTVYYFASGTHTPGTIGPNNNSTFLGSGAIGQTVDSGAGSGAAFGDAVVGNAATGTPNHVVIMYLDIAGFANTQEGSDVVNYDEDPYWTVEYDTIGPNNNVEGSQGGYGLGIGSYNTVEHNCIQQNSEGGFNGIACNGNTNYPAGCYMNPASAAPGVGVAGGPIDEVVEYNDIYANAIGNYGSYDSNCGCAAGGKTFGSLNAVFDYNYIHGNYGDGIWPDFDNEGMDISHNYISNNFGAGIEYEASYNANITANTLVDNGDCVHATNCWPASTIDGYNVASGIGYEEGSTGSSYGAIQLEESQGDPGVASNYQGHLYVADNFFYDNFGGLTVFEDPNRFCGPNPEGQQNCTISNPADFYLPANLTSGGGCDINNLTGASKQSGGYIVAVNTGSPAANYFNGCSWSVRNVSATNNTFSMSSPADIQNCSSATNCGNNALYSYASNDGYSGGTFSANPYYIDAASPSETMGGWIGSPGAANTFNQNAYCGWQGWMAFYAGDTIAQTKWTAGQTNADGTGLNFQPQDTASTFTTGNCRSTPPPS
jgi:hypothetical protein